VSVEQLLALARSASAEGVTIVQTAATAVIIVPVATAATAASDELLSLEEATAVAKVRSPRVLRDAARAGELVLYGKKGARVVRRAELTAWVESRATRRLALPAEDVDLELRMRRLAREAANANADEGAPDAAVSKRRRAGT
jgi:hypothetical protein